ncbi:NAD-dependent epimerase/dehydratase family protein [Streptosporangium sp. DT93]|uniref:NAD-dependent epimerase/dehydratase family protein n=1 Tax=Streptosporangium sp. DT93 TaxID=3393428 RepID=UPI003CE9BD62
MPGAVILGGDGFIGRHITTAMAREGYSVLVVARAPAAGHHRVPGHRRVSADLATTPPARLASLLSTVRPAVVVNAIGGVWGVTEREMESANHAVTTRLVAALSLLNPSPRLVQLGSVLEYGPVEVGVPVGTDVPTRPVTAYGRTKLAATRAVVESSVDAMVLRLSNVIGPGVPTVSLLGQVATELAEARNRGRVAAVELAPLRARRDFVDVRDVAEAVVLAAGAEASGVVNIGRGEAVGVRTLVDLLISVSGVPVRIVERPDAGATPRGELDWFQADLAGATGLLGWKPRRTLPETVRAFWEDFTA